MADQVTKHKLPPEKGAGSVVLYEVKPGHTPPVVTNPQDIEDKRWVLVLFPERWGWAAKSRAMGAREAKGEGPTLAALVLKRTIKTKSKTNSQKKKATKKPEEPKKGEGVARVRAHTKRVEAPENKAQSVEPDSKDDDGMPNSERAQRPEIPASATFDQALDIRFPVERIMDELEDLITASTPVYTKDGDCVGEKPDFPTRMMAVKTAISYREGLARAREKELAEPKRISFDELETMLMENPLACDTLERVIKRARQHQAMKKTGMGVAKTKPS